jgi:hypothetical protein
MTEYKGFFHNLKDFRTHPIKVAWPEKSGGKKTLPPDGRGSLFASKRCNLIAKMIRLRTIITLHFIKQVATLLRGIFIIPFFVS